MHWTPIYILWRMEVWVRERKGNRSLYCEASTVREVAGTLLRGRERAGLHTSGERRGDGCKESVTSLTCQVDFFFFHPMPCNKVVPCLLRNLFGPADTWAL